MADKELVIDVDTMDTIGDLFSAWMYSGTTLSTPEKFIEETMLNLAITKQNMKDILEGEAVVPNNFVPALQAALPFTIDTKSIYDLNKVTRRRGNPYTIEISDADVEAFHYNHMSPEEKKEADERKIAIIKEKKKEYSENSLFEIEEMIDLSKITEKGKIIKNSNTFAARVKKQPIVDTGRFKTNDKLTRRENNSVKFDFKDEVEPDNEDNDNSVINTFYLPVKKRFTYEEKLQRSKASQDRNNIPPENLSEEQYERYMKIKSKRSKTLERYKVMQAAISNYKKKAVDKVNQEIEEFYRLSQENKKRQQN